jgi:hypothetical protein
MKILKHQTRIFLFFVFILSSSCLAEQDLSEAGKASILLRFTSTPSDTEVYVLDTFVGRTPLIVRVNANTPIPYRLRIPDPNFRDYYGTANFTQDTIINVWMRETPTSAIVKTYLMNEPFTLLTNPVTNSSTSEPSQSVTSYTTSNTSQPKQQSRDDFRGFTWGEANASVIQSKETASFSYFDKESDILWYEGIVGSYNASINFTFLFDGKLARGTYLLNEEHTDPVYYLEDYKEIDKILAGLYGSPTIQNESWLNGTIENTQEKHTALSLGNLEFYTIFYNEFTKVEHYMWKGEYGIAHRIAYYSLEHLEQYENEREQRDKQGF